MTSQFLVRTSAALLVITGVFFALSGKAEVVKGSVWSKDEDKLVPHNWNYPFNTQDPSSFTDFANRASWSDGSKRIFFNPRSCRFPNDTNQWFQCYFDFKQINALGERICVNSKLDYYVRGNKINRGDAFECGPWKEVSAEPEPVAPPIQPQQPPAPPAIPSRPDEYGFCFPKGTTNLHILAFASSIFLLGLMLGGLIQKHRKEE